MIALLLAAAAPAAVPMTPLIGTWQCDGHFIRSGRPLAATIVFRDGAIASTIEVDHRDKAPGTYHAAETWSFGPDGVKATIVDASGIRWFDGEQSAATLTLIRRDAGQPLEQFVYTLSATGVLTITWSHRGASGALEAGDILTCSRNGRD